jgi:membrane protease YdiL (CAAX protease family)
MVVHPHSKPRTYPMMLRTWDYRWWKPIVGLMIAVVVFFVAQVALSVILVIGAVVDGGSAPLSERMNAAFDLKTVTPWNMLYLNLSLASLTLVVWLVVRLVHRLRPRWLSSVLPGIRWRFFFACFGLAVVALIVSLVVGALLPHDPNDVSGSAHMPTGRLLATAIVVLLTTPLQALGEEYGFRGYLMQATGSFFDGVAEALGISRRRATIFASALALLVTSVAFAFAHGVQNFPLFFDRFAFGLMAGLVVILVGGLEAGIALHILNNLLAFGIAIAYNQLDGVLTVSEASWWQLPVTIAQNGSYLVLVLLVARKMGLRNSTAPPVAREGAETRPQPVG